MIEERFIIPKKIKVGFNKRSECYSGKLGYIIYYDTFGELRKEKSWNSWRDHSITPEEFENVPVEGFMINRPVGGHKSGWNYRQSYCRVWDPRGFEFEIGIDNFLWILDYCDCLAGKKLIGKFVYSWEGQNLVLLPTNSEEYRKSSEVMKKRENITKDLKASELKPGSLYKIKLGSIPWKREGVSDNYKEHKVIFISEAKFEKNLGKNYETKPIFYEPGSGTERDFIIPVNIKSVEYEVSSGVLTDQEVDSIKERFELTAFSHKFWNTTSPFISEFYIQDEVLEGYLKDSHSIKEKKSYVTIDELGKTINIYKEFVKYSKGDKINFYYSKLNVAHEKYLNCIFDYSGGYMKLHKEVLNLGKIWNKKDETWLDTSYGIPSNSTVYPEATKEDFDKVEENISNMSALPKSLIFYKTTSNYYSESLQQVLSKEALIGGKSLIDSELIIYLPIKK